ncbi:MAG: citrate (Si)-synthase, partial [Candidatus Heimdallarchaeota archaeon]|nr:citrate (Si)-synthase [Candidatus Heimdallarchaeota archaeon]
MVEQNEYAKIIIKGNEYEFPLIVGSEDEISIDFRKFRSTTNNIITYDPGYGNTGSCISNIT